MDVRGSIEDIVTGVREGNKRFASELRSLVEAGRPEGEECLKRLGSTNKRCHVIGVTGWPGAGKSSLVYRIARSFLAENRQVGIIAIDPSSPFTGGSLLGDRERMKGIDGDERLFIRSAATRGHTGGIARATKDFIRILEAMGKEIVIIETVGVGQDQVAVRKMADTIVLVLIPGMGDYLQSLKAGVLEIGDIFVVNKCDRKGVSQMVADLTMVICMNAHANGWKPPIAKTIAVDGSGIDKLMEQIEKHWQYLRANKLTMSKRKSTAKTEILELIKSRCLRYVSERTKLELHLERYAEKICEGSADPYTVVEGILRESGIVTERE